MFLEAQEPVSFHLTEKDGLPDIEFYSMVEDGEGNIWFGCNKGLYRYNGKEYKLYSHPDKKGRSFFNLSLDDKGRVWCNNIAGQFFYIENDKLVFFKDFKGELKGNLAAFLFIGDTIFIRDAEKSITAINITSKKTLYEKDNFGSRDLGIRQGNNIIYLNDDFNFEVFNSSSKEKEIYSPKLKSILSLKGTRCFTNSYKVNNCLFLVIEDQTYRNNRLFSFNLSTKKTTKLKLPVDMINNRIDKIIAIENEVYFATKKGIFVTVFKDEELILREHYLKNVFTTDILKDKNDNIWISSLKNYIWLIPNNSLKAYSNFKDIEVLEKKNDSVCFLGSRNGKLYEKNINNNTLKEWPFTNNTQIRGLDYNIKRQQLFFGSDSKTVVFFEENKTKKKYKRKAALKSITHIKDSVYIVSTHIGVGIETPNSSKKITNIRSYESIYSSKNKEIYVLDLEGIKVFDENYKRKKDITFKNKPIHAFNIVETLDGVIWVATYDEGILRVKDNIITTVLDTKNGLASLSLSTLKSDNENLWIASDKAIQYYNTKLHTFKTLTVKDGINSFNIKDIEVLNNNVIFSSNLGVFGFDKTKIFKEKKAPEVYITSIRIQEEEQDIVNEYVLEQEKSSIDIEFNVRDFQSVKHTLYEYKFNNDSDWISLNEEIDFIKFTKLPVGEFKFQLRAKNKFSETYSGTIHINFKILAPFYKRWWFVFLCILALISAVVFYFKKKTARLKIAQEKELEKARISKALVFSQLENLRSQMNPHFIFNALNSIQDYIILNEKKLARQYLVKFSRLIRVYLEHSQVNEVSLHEEIDALKMYLELEKDRFNDDFKFNISYKEEIIEEDIKVPSLFIQPYVENALKHGLLHKVNNKILNLDFSLDKQTQFLICTIDDNGIGREVSQKIKDSGSVHKSFATQANQKRIDLLNRANTTKIGIEIIDKVNFNQESLGTKVVLKIPYT